MKDVYITKVASYLPNNPIENDQMESFIGFLDLLVVSLLGFVL